MEFVPLWTDILEGPCWKIMDLPPDQYRFWTFCLLAAQKYDFADGHLPDDRTLAHWCQMDRDTCVTLRDKLVERGLIDCVTCAGQDRDMPVTVTNESRIGHKDDPEFRMHDWDHWRAVKDSGAKERKRRQRQKAKGLTEESRNGHGRVTVESQDVTPHLTSSSIQHSSSRVSEQFAPALAHETKSTLTLTPTELDTGRTGEEHALFCKVVQELEGFEETKYLAGQLVMYADTPEIRGYESWRLFVACRVCQKADKGKSWTTFTKSAYNATWEEYQKIIRKLPAGNVPGIPRTFGIIAGP